MDKKRRLTNKYILLAILLIAVFVLPSCRTRISNNSEITTVQYDEDGFMSEEYQMRRDELGLSTAEKPLLPNLGPGETDDSDDFDEGETIDYNPEDFEEDFTEPETNTNTNNSTTNRTNNRTTTTPPRTTPSPSRGTTTTTTRYRITFNANGGKVTENGKETYIVNISRGRSLGTFPKVTRKGYTLDGWYTSQTDGSQVTSTTVVYSSRTLYAHWKKKEKPEPTPTPTPTPETKYTVSLKANGGSGDSEEKVSKDGMYTLPLLTRKGYIHTAWTTEKDGGVTYAPKDQIKITGDITLYAQWDGNPKEIEYWKDAFKSETDGIDEEPICFVTGGDSGIVQDCKAEVKTKDEELESSDYVVIFADDDSDADAINAIVDNPKYSDKNLLVIPKSANKNDKNKMVYKIIILGHIHGTSLIYEDAAENLGVKLNPMILYPSSI